MHDMALQGGFAEAPTQSARAFRAVLNALARPGTIETLVGAQPPAPASIAAGVALLTLADATTPVHLAGAHDTPDLRDWLTFHTGAPLVGAAEAVFALGTWVALAPITRFAMGSPEYPDRSATLIVEMPALHPAGARLTGPGIRDTAHLNLPDIAALRANAADFPLGRDFLFCAGDRLAALPRSTQVEAV
ncbi:phosphonate C-P lyase system protein PhnH [Rhodobacter veldkampii DSM 11550]|uniref:Phosphonate C-P lyase system protein PhnH n=1 Tax=Phaeovulum veldkampii DSM 11550 TaxID=1185920 RepID=A0A2T4JD35_9RHOB|nr:phosphonate C-P lyase system protein PhnH [Phaeovulum veldkampii]MBK5946152.1 phosphonate C-P lyase system protein PhnH [Phaeovulum veldkampii DSM 11550]NCU20017.1 phosphonate C-P lyase system protein PhnH [Candidatus Falkowbacteria bacterium]PTE15822.1 phosphonate C-P lyase system protein PhnH [Phaeovulum veldkampii DSM 11550]TDQ56543.1 alpha-D-ribose 1-methylphosphonate 5-triphosphate synthase subunit PhnH [Phaeovulum veldkampii DSM 11550]